MSFADHPLIVSNPDDLPPKLYRMVEDHTRPKDSRYGLIADEKMLPGKWLIVTQPLLYRSYLRELEAENPQVVIAKKTYLNPKSQAYSEDHWKIVGLRCFDESKIPLEIVSAIELINPHPITERAFTPLLTQKES